MQEEYEIYGGFASVYDEFMDNIPYDAWYEYLHGLLKEYGISDGIVVDIACGTGEITRRLSQDGYDMIGIDISKDMLNIARQKCDPDVLLLCQDMRQMDLYGTAKAMVCLCDGMNYLCRKEDLLQALQRVRLFMDHGGIFIFDMSKCSNFKSHFHEYAKRKLSFLYSFGKMLFFQSHFLPILP